MPGPNEWSRLKHMEWGGHKYEQFTLMVVGDGEKSPDSRLTCCLCGNEFPGAALGLVLGDPSSPPLTIKYFHGYCAREASLRLLRAAKALSDAE